MDWYFEGEVVAALEEGGLSYEERGLSRTLSWWERVMKYRTVMKNAADSRARLNVRPIAMEFVECSIESGGRNVCSLAPLVCEDGEEEEGDGRS